MPIIKLNATDSTNLYLKKLSAENRLQDYTVVVTEKQTHGRGQLGAKWNAKAGENLTFSVFKSDCNLAIERQFYLSIVTSLALITLLEQQNIPKLAIKWPNDILSADKKVSGVLIENTIKHSKIISSIIGVGLNVNQMQFDHLPKAASLKQITGVTFDLEVLLSDFIAILKSYFELLKAENFEAIKQEYHSKLFRKNKPSTFKNEKGDLFSGIIQGVSETGRLCVLLEDAVIIEFNLKELTLLY